MPRRIVVIGGGTGLSAILRGLKHVTKDLSAVVSVADDGGSSGVLRKDLNMLPPGDIRNCILAMSNSSPLLEKLFNYRFDRGSLEGQSFGNLMLAALNEITGSLEHSIKETSNIFNITGKVYPVTLTSIDLQGTLQNGSIVVGESMIPQESLRQGSPIKHIDIVPLRPKTLPEVIQAIEQAEIIVVGPGSLYTSILPALLISGVKEAIIRSQGKCFYIAGLMTQHGETDNMHIRDHIRVIEEHIEDPIFDAVLANAQLPDAETLQEYAAEEAYPVTLTEQDKAYLKDRNILYRESDYLLLKDGYLRHDGRKVSEDLIHFYESIL